MKTKWILIMQVMIQGSTSRRGSMYLNTQGVSISGGQYNLDVLDVLGYSRKEANWMYLISWDIQGEGIEYSGYIGISTELNELECARDRGAFMLE